MGHGSSHGRGNGTRAINRRGVTKLTTRTDNDPFVRASFGGCGHPYCMNAKCKSGGIDPFVSCRLRTTTRISESTASDIPVGGGVVGDGATAASRNSVENWYDGLRAGSAATTAHRIAALGAEGGRRRGGDGGGEDPILKITRSQLQMRDRMANVRL